MTHAFEIATSSRAKCRGCDGKIEKGALRFGEREPNAFGDGEMTLWFHPLCAAYKRPEPVLAALRGPAAPIADGEPPRAAVTVARSAIAEVETLEAIAAHGLAHRRLPRVAGADRAPTGRARCRHCRELIEKGGYRIGLVFFEEYRFQPGGYIHAGCAADYFETTELLERIRHFSPDLRDADDAAALEAAIHAKPGG